MTSTDEELDGRSSLGRRQVPLAIAVVVMVPGLVVRFASLHLSSALAAALFGGAIVGAAFLLSWAAEAAQLDISAGLAIAALALLAVLPEYAVDFVFADKAGHAVAEFGSRCAAANSSTGSPCSLALATMTGA